MAKLTMERDWKEVLHKMYPEPSCHVSLAVLDLSQSKLIELSGIESLQALTDLNLSCNRFQALPPELARLPRLKALNASKNFLRPNALSLLVPGLAQLEDLSLLDIRCNAKCGRQDLVEMLAAGLPRVEVRISLWGQFVGASPSDRDATSLRAQLEPWPTPVLRRRLERDFGETCAELEDLGRAEIMERLLACYEKEGAHRKVIRVNGTPVPEPLLEMLLTELREWSIRCNTNRERPSISAKSYMIIRSPAEFSTKGSKQAKRASKKFEDHAKLWQLALQAISEVDPEFAASYTALAVTRGFQGSPHIDKQNFGPFYGLALGDFPEGQGGVCVECNARLVAHVNTRNRLGKVDGRFPHWVAPYDPESERYSLIYYQTEGAFIPPSAAIYAPPVGEANAALDELGLRYPQ